jgi:hypothetical protein
MNDDEAGLVLLYCALAWLRWWSKERLTVLQIGEAAFWKHADVHRRRAMGSPHKACVCMCCVVDGVANVAGKGRG